MNSPGIFFSIPVMKVESARDDDERSRKEQQKQLERQLPRMRIADEKKSEKFLADALRTGSGKKSEQRPSELPQPATARSLQRRVESGELLNERVAGETPGSGPQDVIAEEKSLISQDFYNLEERLQCRKNPLSASEIL